MNLIVKIDIFIRKSKSFLRLFKLSLYKKKRNLKRVLKSDLACAKQLLKNNGYRHIRDFSCLSWKAYENEHRFTVTAKLGKTKYFIKINTREKNISNSIKVSESFGNKTDFIPKGNAVILPPFYCYRCLYIPSYSFFEIKRYVKQHIKEYVEQAILILDKLNEFKVVHQDLDFTNIIFRKKDKKMMLIDFDNSYSDILNLKCKKPPFRHAIFYDDGNAIIDDAYAFYCIFKS